MKEWEQCFEEGVQFAEVDDGDNEGYEPVPTGDDMLPGADDVWRRKVLLRIETEAFEVVGDAGYDETGSL